MYKLDFSEPRWLINYYHLMGSISVCLNFFGMYLLVFQCHYLDKFRHYLLLFLIMCCSLDVQLTGLMQPVPLYPFFAGYTVGIWAEWFDVSTHVSMMITMFVACVHLECLTICFEKKHQSIAAILNTHVLPKWVEIFGYSLCIICPFAVCFLFNTTHLTTDEQWAFIRTNFTELEPQFRTLKHFDIYIKTPMLILCMICVIIGGVALSTIFVFFIVDIIQIMHHLKPRISKANYEKHGEAIHSLKIQLMTASICYLGPCLLVIVIFTGIENAQLLSELCIALAASHSSVNMVSLLIFFPPFRKFILKKLRKSSAIRRGIVGTSSIAI